LLGREVKTRGWKIYKKERERVDVATEYMPIERKRRINEI
jgi:hypothetical protein